MARSTGIAITVGAVAFANQMLLEPAAGGRGAVQNWRIVPATAGLALGLAGLEKLAPDFAVGIGYIALLAVLIIPMNGFHTPLDNAAKMFSGGVTKK